MIVIVGNKIFVTVGLWDIQTNHELSRYAELPYGRGNEGYRH